MEGKELKSLPHTQKYFNLNIAPKNECFLFHQSDAALHSILEALESVMCDVIKLCLKRRIAKWESKQAAKY